MADEPRTSSGTLPDSFVGADNHGPDLISPGFDPSGPDDGMMSSVVWNGVSRAITSRHGQSCGYCAVAWPTSVGMAPHTHPGVDISMVTGTPLHAAAAGTVTYAGWSPKYYRPNQVQVTTPTGELHIYAHMWSVAPGIVDGTWVNRGDYLGTSGEQTIEGTMTPDGSGAHLHFEARRTSDGVALDPGPILTAGTTSITPAAPNVKPGDRVQVASPDLRLREGPGTSHGIVRELETGLSLAVIAGPEQHAGYSWAKVKTPDGAVGWVALEFTTLEANGPSGFQEGDRIALADANVRFRTGPGLDSGVIREFDRGEQVCVAGASTTAGGFAWYPVRTTAGEKGWVAGDFCELVKSGGCRDGPPDPVTRENWPTAETIDERIRLSNKVNGRTSKLTGKGSLFVSLGEEFGINPAIAVAIAQRECQMGADGSELPEAFYNFGGITAGGNGEYPGPCGFRFHGDRYWKVFCSPEDGVRGLFQLLDTPLYRKTGGRFEEIMRLYSPPHENPWTGPGNIWEKFQAVGKQLQVAISRDTNIYA